MARSFNLVNHLTYLEERTNMDLDLTLDQFKALSPIPEILWQVVEGRQADENLRAVIEDAVATIRRQIPSSVLERPNGYTACLIRAAEAFLTSFESRPDLSGSGLHQSQTTGASDNKPGQRMNMTTLNSREVVTPPGRMSHCHVCGFAVEPHEPGTISVTELFNYPVEISPAFGDTYWCQHCQKDHLAMDIRDTAVWCPSCGNLVRVGAPRCPWCGQKMR